MIPVASCPKTRGSLREPIPLYHVGSTDSACHDFQQKFVGTNLGFRDFLDSYVPVVVVDGYKHWFTKKFGMRLMPFPLLPGQIILVLLWV